MPPAKQDPRDSIDFRPAGAVAGAALPAKSLLDYFRHDYPTYKKLLEAAEDATDIRGNVDINKVLKTLKPGDFGLSGLQGGDALTNVLVQGSHAASGGVGAHGQIVGPNVKVKSTLAKTPKGEMPPDLTFLKNEAGEMHAPALAKNRQKFVDAIPTDGNPTHYGTAGTDTYGNMKEQLQARSKQLGDLKARVKAWDAYDKSTSNAKPPKGARPSAQEMARLQKLEGLKGKSVKNFKKFLAKPELKKFFDPKTPTGKADDFLAGIRGDMAQTPAAQQAANELKKQKLTDLADRLSAKSPANPKLKDIAENLRTQVDSVGVPGPAPAKSKLFKPKQFETFVPTVLHGGMHDTAIHRSGTVDAIAHHFQDAFSPEQYKKFKADPSVPYGFSYLRDALRDNASWKPHDAAVAARRPGAMYGHYSDNLYRHTLNEGSSINPGGWYGGRKGTLYLRPKKGVDPAMLEKLIKQEGLKPYATGNAALGAIGEITGLSNLAKYIPGFNKAVNTCDSHMCGSFPAKVYEAAGSIKNKFPAAITLPNRVAITEGFEPLIATNKQLLLKQLRTGGGRRALLGAGAIGLMGAAGYNTTGAAQNAVRSAMPKAAPPAVPMPAPSMMPSFKGMGKYAPVAAVGAGSAAALAAAYAWGRSRRKKPADELSPAPA